MKRVFAIFLTCVFLLGLLPTSALAAEPDTGGLCPHHQEHSFEDCGFIEAVEGQLCGYVCPVCPVQAMIDALPAAEELSGMSKDEQNEVYNALQAAHDAYEALTEEQQKEISGAEVFEILFAFFNGMVNLLEAQKLSIENGSVTITADTCPPDCPGHIITGTSTGNTITVTGGTHNITLQNIDIDVSAQNKTAAFSIEGSAKVNLTLEEKNTLKSGNNCAGLQVPDGAELVITESSTGSLDVTGSAGGAGIGGGYSGAGGIIIINGGVVNAISYGYGAGIGGGFSGDGGTITISGGTVEAWGIGGGRNGEDGTFTADGNAFIVTDSISDKTNVNSWSGVIFVGNAGQVYGSSVELTTDAEVPSGKKLTIGDGQTLTVGNDVTLTNKGTITVKPGGQLAGAVTGGGTVNRPSTETGVKAVSVSGTPGNINGTEITVALPYGADPTQIRITLVDENATFSTPATADGGATWTFTVTAEDRTTTANYTINVSIAPDPAAGNKADVAKAKTAIETHTWTVGQATANTEAAVKSWIESVLQSINLNDVTCTVSITGFTAATAGNSADQNGTNGSFTFTVSLSKGADNTLATDTAAGINGTIIATPYQAQSYTVSVSASPAEGGTVNGGGTYTENTSVKVSASANSGYHFVKWTEGGGEISTSTDYTFTLTGSRTLVAVFEKDGGTTPPQPTEYIVTFDGNGGTSPAAQTTTGRKLTSLPTSTQSGYSFNGWYTAKTGGDKVTLDTVFTASVTVYAQWTKNSGGNSGGSGSGGGSSGGGTTTTPTQKPSIEDSTGGSTTVTPVRPGETATIRPRPDEGYEVDKITVTDRNGKPVEVTKKPDGTYTFTQPTGKVKIEVTYKPTQPIDRPWNNPFTDVSGGDWFYEAVRFVQENGLMNGYSDGRFGANDTLSRAQLAQILFNKEGRPAVSGGGFNDVDSGAWYADAVTWAAENGIVGGYGNGTFGPNDPITREQLAVMLWRYSGSPAATDKELHFNDTDEISGFALDAMRWAVENGILNGYGDGRLGPQGQATRAQVAQMLKNFFEKG